MNNSIPVASALDEETARAELYGLLAALTYAPPTAQMLEQLRVAVTQAPREGAFLEESWQALVAAARAQDDHSIEREYTALFGGLGKPEIYLFGSHYLAGFLNEKPLAQLRGDLAQLGLTRDQSMPETEDHIAYLCEVMRFLIAGDDAGVSNLAGQKHFFATHLQPWVLDLCTALTAHPQARFYASLGAFVRAFMSVEVQGFDLL
jgi:TorA maturation chaperone TorD